LLFVGDDWAEDHRDIEIVDTTGQVLHVGDCRRDWGITRLHALIAERMPARWADLETGQAAAMVNVGIKSDRGPWVAALIITGYEVFAINPMSAARYRQRHSTSGAKSDTATRTCWPRSSAWTGHTTDRSPATATRVRPSS
jgi:Transposase